MRKIIVHCFNTKSIGCDCHEAIVVPEDWSDDRINEIAFGMAVDEASMYWEVVDASEYDDEDDGMISTEDIDYSWWDYNPEVHDMHRIGGGSFEDDFKVLLED